MRVYNLTDVATPLLERHGLLNQRVVAHRRVVEPGQYVEVEDNASMRARLAHLLTVGAISIDQIPPAYLKAKQLATPQTGTFGNIAMRHIDVRETVTAGEPLTTPVASTTPPVVLKSNRKKGRS